jgi:hypothetical protein
VQDLVDLTGLSKGRVSKDGLEAGRDIFFGFCNRSLDQAPYTC